MKFAPVIFISLFISACATNGPEPIDVYSLQKTALLSYQKKDWRTAHDAFKRLVEINPSDAELWFKLGNVSARLNLPEQAIASYKEALVRDPSMSKAWHNVGVVSLRKTTRLFIEMLQHIPESDPLYTEAKETGEALLQIIEERKLDSKSVKNYPDPLSKPDDSKQGNATGAE